MSLLSRLAFVNLRLLDRHFSAYRKGSGMKTPVYELSLSDFVKVKIRFLCSNRPDSCVS